MPGPYLTPDVYIEEISVFPPSVVAVGTAIPAFIGYTEKAIRNNLGDLNVKPTKIFSLNEYETYFGGPFVGKIAIELEEVGETFRVTSFTAPGAAGPNQLNTPPPYFLYCAIKMYFANGGSECYVVSVGGYANPAAVDGDELKAGLEAIRSEDEPTLIVIPEAVKLGSAKFDSVSQDSIKQAAELQDRFVIVDILGGGDSLDTAGQLAARARFGTNNLKYAAAYFPFLRTSLNYFVTEAEDNVSVKVGAAAAKNMGTFKTSKTALYNYVKAALHNYFIVLPPSSAAVAGVYAAVDGSRGVWKAPANVSLADVIEPLVKVDSKGQETLNVDATSGKSINVIRSFAGKGTLIWGARTLDGNSNEWRYVSVRRFFNMVEESVKKATYWAVFENNDANTWVKVRGMIENFLIDQWRDGALAGATIKEAFFVKCGLGSTMSAQDILEGRLNVEIGLAVVRPAEFLILKFSHKLQTS